MSLSKIYTCLIGNPGVGKSTFLNGIIKDVKFKSGDSMTGAGVTTSLQIYQDERSNFYIDTPGLSDIKSRENAAKELEKALKQDGLYRIIFVVTLESGRIRPDDKVTMRLVLEAAPIRGQYSIIINKVNKSWHNKLINGSYEKEWLCNLNEGLPYPCSTIYFYYYDGDLDSADNIVPELTSDFYAFLAKVPFIIVNPSDVKEVALDQWESERKKMEQLMEEQKRIFGIEIAEIKQRSEEQERAIRIRLEQESSKLQQLRHDNEANMRRVMEKHRSDVESYQKRLEQSREEARKREAQGRSRSGGGFFRKVLNFLGF